MGAIHPRTRLQTLSSQFSSLAGGPRPRVTNEPHTQEGGDNSSPSGPVARATRASTSGFKNTVLRLRCWQQGMGLGRKQGQPWTWMKQGPLGSQIPLRPSESTSSTTSSCSLRGPVLAAKRKPWAAWCLTEALPVRSHGLESQL